MQKYKRDIWTMTGQRYFCWRGFINTLFEFVNNRVSIGGKAKENQIGILSWNKIENSSENNLVLLLQATWDRRKKPFIDFFKPLVENGNLNGVETSKLRRQVELDRIRSLVYEPILHSPPTMFFMFQYVRSTRRHHLATNIWG